MPRFTIDFDALTDKQLTDTADRKNISKAEIIRRALALYFSLDERMSSDMRLNLIDKNGNVVVEVVFI